MAAYWFNAHGWDYQYELELLHSAYKAGKLALEEEHARQQKLASVEVANDDSDYDPEQPSASDIFKHLSGAALQSLKAFQGSLRSRDLPGMGESFLGVRPR